MGYEFELNNELHRVESTHLPGGLDLLIDGRRVRASLRLLTRPVGRPVGQPGERPDGQPGGRPGQQVLELDGREEKVWIATRGDVHFVHFQGRTHRVQAVNALTRARQAAEPSGGSELLRAPMPGVVVEVVAVAGSQVAAGQLLMTIESMKLQTLIRAPHAARVEEVFVSAGAAFDEGAALVRLAADDDAADARDTADAEKASGADASTGGGAE